MTNLYARLLDTRVLGPSQYCPPERVLDLGAYGILVLDPRIMTVGTAGNLLIETASLMEEGAWRVVATIPLNATSAIVAVTPFLRYVRWRTDAAVAGNPVVLVDLVAKNG